MNEMPLESRLERLEAIADALESDDLELDAALELFEEAVVHLREARVQLHDAELRVEEMIGRAEQPELRSLDHLKE